MRQLITRLDDDLHSRLKVAAQAAGTSVNALVVEVLQRAVDAPVDQRAALRQRAHDAGRLFVPPVPARVLPRDEVIASTRGAGTAVSEALAADREGR